MISGKHSGSFIAVNKNLPSHKQQHQYLNTAGMLPHNPSGWFYSA
jgi:hypothetical protein